MNEKSHLFEKIRKKSLENFPRLFIITGIYLLFIQLIFTPALAQNEKFYDGYNIITYEDGSKEIVSGDLNFLRFDNVWRPKDELNISNGSWPYFYTENETYADFKADDTILSIPTENTEFNLKPNSISYSMKFSKEELDKKQISVNLTDAYLEIPYLLKSKKPKNEYEDEFNIKYGNFHFKGGEGHIIVHDDTPRKYIEDGKEFEDVTYLSPRDYVLKIEKGHIRLKFKKKALDKLAGNVVVQVRTWDIVGPNNWGGNDVSFSQTTEVKATGNAELRQMFDDYALYTRFDEGSGNIIHNENTLNSVPALGDLLGIVENGTYIGGKYGQAIHFNGIDNKVLFNDHPDFRLPYDFTISYYIKLAPDESNVDSDITRKGSTATADPDSWWKIEITENASNYQLMHGSITLNGSSAFESYDNEDRRDGNWHFVVYNRGGTSCSLIVDGILQTTNECPTNATNTALLSIGSKDTYFQTSGLDFTHGTIDEVRIYNRQLNALELESIGNNSHYPEGAITRNLSSLIGGNEELKEIVFSGTWDRSTTTVDILASANNTTWDIIQSNIIPNYSYSIDPGNNYTYLRCLLSTTDNSKTPAIENIRARIVPKGLYYTISVSTSPSDLYPQPSGGDEYTPGQDATVIAQPVTGYTFRNWTENGIQVSDNPIYQFTVTGDRNLVAEYTQDLSYTIFVSTSPSGLFPQPAGGGEYPSGQNITVTAQHVRGYSFRNWIENGIQVSDTPIYQFNLTADRHLVAVYALNTGSLVGWWKLDNDMLDWSGDGNDGECSGTECPNPTTGKVSGAFYFDGTNDFIKVVNGTRLNITGNITIEAWVKPAKLATQYIAKKSSMGTTNGYELSLASSGKSFFRVNQKNSGNTYRVDSISTYPSNNSTWIYLVATYNMTNISIYLNGKLENSIKGPSNISSNTDDFEIGGPDGLAYLKGAIDDVRIWNRALTSQEIEASYKAANRPPVSEAGGPYTVNEGSPVIVDASGSTDPDGDALVYSWDLDNDGTYETSGITATITPSGETSIYTVGLKVSDGNGGVSIDTADIMVNNVAPVVNAGPDATLDEGSGFSSSGSFADPGNDTWTATVDYGDGSGVQSLSLSDKTFSLYHVYSDNGTYTVTVTVKDDDLGEGSDTATVTVNNVAPTADAGPDATLDEGSGFSSSGSFADPGNDTWTATVDYGDGSGLQSLSLSDKTFSLSHVYSDNGSYTVTVTVKDDDLGESTDTATVSVNNIAPTADAGPDATLDEGSGFSSSGSFADPGNDTWTATVDYGDGSGVQSLSLSDKTFSLYHVYSDNGSYTVTVTVKDDDLGEGISTATVTVTNVDPTIGPIIGPIDPVSAGTSVTASATFSDPGILDTHIAIWNWGDGSTSPGTVTETSELVAGNHIYTKAGIYTVSLMVTDDDGGAGSAAFSYIVIYDASGGFVTGGGWINSSEGAYIPDPNLNGRASFNIDSKYQKGAQVPTGDSEFQFEVANLNFNSTAYEWLVVNGTSARFKGTGTINGLGTYSFMLTAIDDTPDRFRIQIWNKTSEEIVYDNKNGSSDTGNDATELGGGNIIIHVK